MAIQRALSFKTFIPFHAQAVFRIFEPRSLSFIVEALPFVVERQALLSIFELQPHIFAVELQALLFIVKLQ